MSFDYELTHIPDFMDLLHPDIHAAVAKRLRELEAGEAPLADSCGICYDIDETLRGNGCYYPYCSQIFGALGLSRVCPLYDSNLQGDKWKGDYGVARRALAGQMAGYIEQRFLR